MPSTCIPINFVFTYFIHLCNTFNPITCTALGLMGKHLQRNAELEYCIRPLTGPLATGANATISAETIIECMAAHLDSALMTGLLGPQETRPNSTAPLSMPTAYGAHI